MIPHYKPTIRFRCANLHSHTIVFFCVRSFPQWGKKSLYLHSYFNATAISRDFSSIFILFTTIWFFYKLNRQNKGALKIKYECSFKKNSTSLFILASSCKLADCTIIADDYWLILFAMNFTNFLLGIVHKWCPIFLSHFWPPLPPLIQFLPYTIWFF